MDSVAQGADPLHIVVFFFYGLSYFVLGIAISLQSRKGTDFRFGRYLWLLAIFGFLHGAKEWLEMFTMIGGLFWTRRGIETLTVIRFTLAMVSYIFLCIFALDLLVPEKSRKRVVAPAAVILGGTSAVILTLRCIPGVGGLLSLHFDVLVRYGFGFPAIGMTAFALFRHRGSPEIARLDSASLRRSFTAAAVLFGMYAVLDGLVVEHDTFFPATILSYRNFEHLSIVPVQVYRTLCAFGIVYCMLRILKVFELEKGAKLEKAYREIISTSTREQERIGQDIHDGLCQELAGILLYGKALEKQLAKRQSSEAGQVKKMNGMIDQAISEARALSKSLYPVEIEGHGLLHALGHFADTVTERYAVACEIMHDADCRILDHQVATHLFRIAQEAITNAVRHGKATKVTVSLHRRDDTVMALSVHDNGSGMTGNAGSTGGMGIKIMKYRARVIGGTLDIIPRAQGGTSVVCLISCKERTSG